MLSNGHLLFNIDVVINISDVETLKKALEEIKNLCREERKS